MSTVPSFEKLSILIAVYNEQDTLNACIQKVLAAPLPPGLAHATRVRPHRPGR